MKKEVKEAFKDSLPVLSGYIILGIGFGVTLFENGYGVFASFLMSAFIYAGSMQYVTISLLQSSASLITAVLMTIVVNIRHLFYGIAMLDRYRSIKKHRNYCIFSLTDETFSIVSANKDSGKSDDYYFYLSAFDQTYWVLGSIIGSLLGKVLPISKGVEFSMTALFLCVFLDQWKNTEDHSAAIAGMLISVGCLLLFGKSSFLIPSILFICLFLIFKRRYAK